MTYSAAAHKLTRVNYEIKKGNLLINESQWQKACRQVLTEEQFEAVQETKRRIEEGLV